MCPSTQAWNSLYWKPGQYCKPKGMLSFNLLWQTPVWSALTNHPKLHPSPYSSQFLWQQRWGWHSLGTATGICRWPETGCHSTLTSISTSSPAPGGRGGSVGAEHAAGVVFRQEVSLSWGIKNNNRRVRARQLSYKRSSMNFTIPSVLWLPVQKSTQTTTLFGGKKIHTDFKCDEIMQRKGFH